MKYEIIKESEVVNTIVADEIFVKRYCKEHGCRYKKIPVPESVKPKPTAEERVDVLEKDLIAITAAIEKGLSL